jgi:hypothetical protein
VPRRCRSTARTAPRRLLPDIGRHEDYECAVVAAEDNPDFPDFPLFVGGRMSRQVCRLKLGEVRLGWILCQFRQLVASGSINPDRTSAITSSIPSPTVRLVVNFRRSSAFWKDTR